MNELAKTGQSFSALMGLDGAKNDPLYQAVALSISLLSKSLKMYGRTVDGLADPWFLLFKKANVTIQEVAAATEAFMGGESGWEFPEPGQVVKWIRNRREDLEMQAALVRAVEERAEARVREVEDWCLATFGVGNPDRAEVQKRLADNPIFHVVMGDTERPARVIPPMPDLEPDPERLKARDEFMKRSGG